MHYDGQVSSNQQEICELFSQYFCSVFEPPSSRSVTMTPITNPVSTLSNIMIMKADILKKIANLDVNKGSGPDGIPPLVIKNCSKELSEPLAIIFNASLQSGTFPSVWKTAHIVPIFKSGEKSNCNNYRPISILSCLGKLFESLVVDGLYRHLSPLVTPLQHGFVRNRSTTSNLLEFKNYICCAFAKRIQVDSIYTDFSKAFDKVDHKILIQKLDVYFGIHGNLLRWVKSYLHRRSQLVAVKGFLSSPAPITSGVPQGSHLGPLLFIAFINDLVSHFRSPCLLYADDLKLYSTIRSISDCDALQSDLYTLHKWCGENGMSLNVKKCFAISFTTKRNKVMYNYKLRDHCLERKAVIKDLGILLDEKFTFRDHYDYIISRCNQIIGFITRITKDFKNPYSSLNLYYSMVRSILEYNSVIWTPFYIIHTKRIERVQSKFLNILRYRLGLKRELQSYTKRLATFNTQSLAIRRKYIDMVYLFKIVHSYIDSPTLLSGINLNTRCGSRNPNSKTFALQVYRNNTSYYNPVVRMCRQYNEIVKNNHDSIDVFDGKMSKFKADVRKIVFTMCRKQT